MACHDLLALFNRIPERDRAELKRRLESNKDVASYVVSDEIEEMKIHFEKWRYSYEKIDGIGVDSFVKTFVCTVCDYVLEENYK